MPAKKSLVEKIAEACKGVEPIVKVESANVQYPYLRILDLANALREKLLAAGVLIIPSDELTTTEHRQVEDLPRFMSYAVVKTGFTLTDGRESLGPFFSTGFAKDMDGKCVMIAETTALKSFLKRLALIFGDYDDPEIEQEQIADTRPDLQRKIDEQTTITRRDIRAFYAACRENGRTLEQMSEYLKQTWGIVDVPQIQQKDFRAAMAWAFGQEGEAVMDVTS